MRYRGARVVAIDDQKPHLIGIVNALHRTGVGVLPFHYTGERSLKRCAAGVRIVFSDISVLGSGGQAHQQHAAVAAILDRILDHENGPWMMVAWTSSPDQVDDLHKVLVTSLGPSRAPMASMPLAKSEFMRADHKFRIGAIARAIEERVGRDPVVASIFDLELRAAEAARDITRTIVAMGLQENGPTIPDVLKALSKAANASVEPSPELLFRTISPAFQDRMARRTVSKAERRIWTEAFALAGDRPLSTSDRAELNASLHLDPIAQAGDRGALSRVPEELHTSLARAIGMELDEAVFEHYLDQNKTLSSARKFLAKPHPPDAALLTAFRKGLSWWLVEAVPSCDVSNNKRGLRRALVGLGVSQEAGEQKAAGNHVARLPLLKVDGADVMIYITAKITLSPHRGKLAAIRPAGRFRDAVLDEIMIHVAESQSRLGHVSF